MYLRKGITTIEADPAAWVAMGWSRFRDFMVCQYMQFPVSPV
jgi:hypothetical protein